MSNQPVLVHNPGRCDRSVYSLVDSLKLVTDEHGCDTDKGDEEEPVWRVAAIKERRFVIAHHSNSGFQPLTIQRL